MRLWGKTRRINKECLTQGHDWDWFGHPNLICNRLGCTVRGDDLTEEQRLGGIGVKTLREEDPEPYKGRHARKGRITLSKNEIRFEQFEGDDIVVRPIT